MSFLDRALRKSEEALVSNLLGAFTAIGNGIDIAESEIACDENTNFNHLGLGFRVQPLTTITSNWRAAFGAHHCCGYNSISTSRAIPINFKFYIQGHPPLQGRIIAPSESTPFFPLSMSRLNVKNDEK